MIVGMKTFRYLKMGLVLLGLLFLIACGGGTTPTPSPNPTPTNPTTPTTPTNPSNPSPTNPEPTTPTTVIAIVPVNDIFFDIDANQYNFDIRNDGGAATTLNYAVTASDFKKDGAATAAWFDVLQGTGSVQGGSKATVSLKAKANLSAPTKSYTAKLAINDGVKVTTVNVIWNSIGSLVTCSIGANSIVLSNQSNTNIEFVIRLTNLKLNGAATQNQWLTVTPNEGSLQSVSASTIGQQPNTVINLKPKTGLNNGTYSATLNIDVKKAGTNTVLFTKPFTLTLPVKKAVPDMPSQNLNLVEGTKSFQVGNKGPIGTTLNWHVEVTNNKRNGTARAPWFEVAAASGALTVPASGNPARQTVVVTRNDDLTPGTYTADVKVKHDLGQSTFKVTSTIQEGKGFIPITPLSFAATQSASFGIQNTGPANSVIAWTIDVVNNTKNGNPRAGDLDWVDVSPQSGSTFGTKQTPVTLTLKPNLESGFYTGELWVNFPAGRQGFRLSAQVGGVAVPADFDINYNSEVNAIPALERGDVHRNVPIAVTREGSFGAGVTFSLVSPPAGITASFSPATVTTDQSETYMTVNVGSGAAIKAHTLTVKAEGGGKSHTVSVPLTVKATQPAPDYSLSANPATLSIGTGTNKNSNITVNKVGAFAGDVTFSGANPPAGISLSFTPVTNKTATTAKISVANSVAPGTYAVTISGKSGGKTKSTVITVQVTATDPRNAKIRGTLLSDNDMSKFQVPLVATSSQALATQSASTQANRPKYVPGQLLIKLADNGLAVQSLGNSHASKLQSLTSELGLRVVESGQGRTADVVALAANQDVEGMAAQLSSDPRISYAEPNFYIYPQSLPNDTEFKKQWYLAASGVPVGWDRRAGVDNNIIVAVLDTGIDYRRGSAGHPDLPAGRFVAGKDFCPNSSCSGTDNDPTPEFSGDTHGTHVAGIIAAAGNNGQGIAGVARNGVRILPVKVFYRANFTTAAALANSIRWAAGVDSNPNPAKILNLSLGTDQDSTAVRDAINAAAGRGALIVAAAGNYGQTSVLYPAAYNNVMAVGSVNSQFRKSCFSHTGAGIDLMAAGGDYDISKVYGGTSCPAGTKPEGIQSTITSSSYGLLFGTSQSAPIVSAAAALVWSQNNGGANEANWNATQVRNHLKNTAHFNNSYMNANSYGSGVLRLDRALGLAGPGDVVTITARGTASNVTKNTTVALDLRGSTKSYEIAGLPGDIYELKATATKLQDVETVNLPVSGTVNRNLAMLPF